MRIKLRTERCISSGACLVEAPRLFTQDENGLVAVRATEPVEGDYAAVRAAAAACPAAVIEIEETPGDQVP